MQVTPGQLSFTFDAWTSATMTPFIGVTVHFIDKTWNLRSHLLSFDTLPGSHTSENQAAHLLNIFADYDVKDKVCVYGSACYIY